MAHSVGFIGLGTMGRPMALNLVRAGLEVVVHSRSPGPVEDLVAAGAAAAKSPAAALEATEVVITMLPDAPEVQEVVCGHRGLLSAARPETLLIDMSTIAPGAARELAARTGAHSMVMLDAPVSGGERGAVEGTLSIMVGGSAAGFEAARPLFDILGRSSVHVGPSGAGQVAKACNQLVVAAGIEAVAEALALARRAGVEPSLVREALSGGFASSKVLEVHGRRMLDADYEPGFRVDLHRKDAQIVRRTLDEVGLRAPAFEAVARRLDALVDTGRGELDHSALFLLLEEPAPA